MENQIILRRIRQCIGPWESIWVAKYYGGEMDEVEGETPYAGSVRPEIVVAALAERNPEYKVYWME